MTNYSYKLTIVSSNTIVSSTMTLLVYQIYQLHRDIEKLFFLSVYKDLSATET